MPKRLEFRVGQSFLALEVPPFFINFEKRNFSSLMARRQSDNSGILVYIYITRKHHVENLLLKEIHPDLFIPQEINVTENQISTEEIEGFITSVKDLEHYWVYQGAEIWVRRFGAFTLSMILIIGEDRWTVRPAISKKRMKGYGVEIPVDTELAEEFKNELKDVKLEEVHDHKDTQHFLLTVDDRSSMSKSAA